MLRFRKLLFLPMLAVLVFLTRPCSAALIPRYDLESLCYLSTDVVEAAIVRHHAAGHPEWEDRFTATVVSALAGKYKPGDKIGSLDLTLYNPNANGQRCLLFLARRDPFSPAPPKSILPHPVDLLLIDGHDRVRRYSQLDNPGGLDAEGYEPDSSQDQLSPGDLAAQARFPTLAAERGVIKARWAAADRLRPLLTRTPTRGDVPALQALVRARRFPSGPGLQNVVRGVAEERLAELHVKEDRIFGSKGDQSNVHCGIG